jgi:hypothetical protein
VAAAAVLRQQRHGRARAEQPGAVRDGGRAGGADRQAQLGAGGGDPRALAAPLCRLPGHRLAQPGDVLHDLVRRVASTARVARYQNVYHMQWCVAKCKVDITSLHLYLVDSDSTEIDLATEVLFSSQYLKNKSVDAILLSRGALYLQIPGHIP